MDYSHRAIHECRFFGIVSFHSNKTIKNIHGIFHKALQRAVKVGYLRFNPADACELPRMEHREVKPLDDEAIAAFMKAIQGHRFETVYLTMLFTGMRRGEVCGLTWDCVDLEQGTIRVDKQLQNIPGQPGAFRLISTKNNKGRTIPVAPFVVEILKKYKASAPSGQKSNSFLGWISAWLRYRP